MVCSKSRSDGLVALFIAGRIMATEIETARVFLISAPAPGNAPDSLCNRFNHICRLSSFDPIYFPERDRRLLNKSIKAPGDSENWSIANAADDKICERGKRTELPRQSEKRLV